MESGEDSPRGSKRSAERAELVENRRPRKIKALDPDVVNKIAAGEIIVAPVHALKELIENAVDAGSTSLEIVVKEGGLKLLQITDNGHGIDKGDLGILCERFTTSKLQKFEDLMSMNTYGFRGEALASISHIAHLTVTTKTQASNCAWRAHYANGNLVPAKPGQSAEPKATAGRKGTQITVEDLFYNIPTRRRAFRSASEEYAKILDLVGRYAVHCNGVAFSCKKHGDAAMGIATVAQASTEDRVRQIHGSAVANELVDFESSDTHLGFNVKGWTSNANYHVKRTTLLLFINHRAVESSAIKKAVEQTYADFLPKGGHPFTYLSLDIEPQRVDVNVHPTKREVNFLNEESIVERICDEIRTVLSQVDESRTFMTQTLLPGAGIPNLASQADAGFDNDTTRRSSTQKPYDSSNLVRTDAKLRKITSMLPSVGALQVDEANDTVRDNLDNEFELSDREPINCRLTSVRELRAEVRENLHSDLMEIFSGHTFIGVVDEQRRIVAIQGGVKLLLVDYGMVSNEFFYQIGLTDFGNFGAIQFEPSLSLRSLLKIAVDLEKETMDNDSSQPFDWEAAVIKVHDQLMSRREMLGEYFSMSISEEGDLLSIPLLLKGYRPSLAKLPTFLLHLGPNVVWTNEKECFRSFLSELASYYVPEKLPPAPQSSSTELAEEDPFNARRKRLHFALENVIFPAFRTRLVATRDLARGVVEVANLKGLYRVFERC